MGNSPLLYHSIKKNIIAHWPVYAMTTRYAKTGLIVGSIAFCLFIFFQSVVRPAAYLGGRDGDEKVDHSNQQNRKINSFNSGFQEINFRKVNGVVVNANPDKKTQYAPNFEEFLVKYKECIFNQPKKMSWTVTVDTINKCQAQFTNFNESLFIVHVRLDQDQETKVYMKYSNLDGKRTKNSQSCTMLTVGVGRDILAEQEMVARYPNCQLWGMDPKQLEGWEFIQVGSYVPYGLTVEGGMLNLTVRKPDKSYGTENVPTISMDQLVKRYTGPITIHFAVMDIEGGEYILLPEFENGGAFDRAPLNFCQIDIEFHGPLPWMAVKNSEGFYTFFKKFIENGPFVPIHGKTQYLSRKVTVVNVENEECQMLFGIKEQIKHQ